MKRFSVVVIRAWNVYEGVVGEFLSSGSDDFVNRTFTGAVEISMRSEDDACPEQAQASCVKNDEVRRKLLILKRCSVKQSGRLILLRYFFHSLGCCNSRSHKLLVNMCVCLSLWMCARSRLCLSLYQPVCLSLSAGVSL